MIENLNGLISLAVIVTICALSILSLVKLGASKSKENSEDYYRDLL